MSTRARGSRARTRRPGAAGADRSHRTRGPWSSRSLRLLLVTTIGGFGGYTLLQSVVPLWAVAGGAGEIAAGATNSVFMLVTVLTQLAMPWLLRRVDHRVALGAGTALIGVPAPLFALSSELWALFAISGLRGIGFGLLTVSGSALVAEIVPSAQRGRATALYGLSVGLPNLAFLPAGVWLAQHVGFVPLFWLAGALPVVLTSAVVGIKRIRTDSGTVRAATERPRLVRLLIPWTVMTVVALAAGGLIAFLPLAITGTTAVIALTVFGAATMLGRLYAGILSDRIESRHVLLPATVLAGAGMALLCASAILGSAWLAVGGALVFGSGFGAVQNVTLVLLFDRADSGSASTVWNIAYDAGNGLGSITFGVLVVATGYPSTFGITAVLVLVSAVLTIKGSSFGTRNGR